MRGVRDGGGGRVLEVLEVEGGWRWGRLEMGEVEGGWRWRL